MDSFLHLRNAPITEALLDFRIKQPSELPDSDFPVEEFETIKGELANSYPYVEKKAMRSFHWELQGKHTRQQLSEQGIQGYWFYNHDRTRIAQFRFDGFTYNMLKPYTCWEDMEGEALRLWRYYERLMRPKSILRIATRYINHLELPLPIDYKVYFKATPFGFNVLPGEMTSFHNRAVISGSDETQASVVLALEGRSNDAVTILLDIDAFRQAVHLKFPLQNDAMQPILSNLRYLKNSVFYSCLTPKTIDQYR